MKMLTFHNAPGSTVPEQFALAARHNPDHIVEMAETPSEVVELRKEALVRQYVIIVDRSGSMAFRDGAGTRWDSAQKAVEKLVETVFKYDVDHSVPVYVFDDQVTFVGECTDVGQVAGIFQQYKPRGTTDLAKALDTAMEEYAGRKRPDFAQIPGTTFIVILDGSTDDDDAVIRVIKKFADLKNGYIQNHSQNRRFLRPDRRRRRRNAVPAVPGRRDGRARHRRHEESDNIVHARRRRQAAHGCDLRLKWLKGVNQ
jgi:von Willebrand factor type A domain